MKKFFNEFKTFAMRGNVMDMAIGVVIGAAFGKITTSIVNDIIMPLIGLITGGIDLTQWNILLNSAAVEAGADPVTLGIGNLALRPYRHAAEAAFYRGLCGGTVPEDEEYSA